MYVLIISAREKLAVCDVTNLPYWYIDINWQSISIYGYFVMRHWPPTIRVWILIKFQHLTHRMTTKSLFLVHSLSRNLHRHPCLVLHQVLQHPCQVLVMNTASYILSNIAIKLRQFIFHTVYYNDYTICCQKQSYETFNNELVI